MFIVLLALEPKIFEIWQFSIGFMLIAAENKSTQSKNYHIISSLPYLTENTSR